jgi:hypothetical protein
VLDTLERPRERADARPLRGSGRPHRAPAAPRDPFFEQPYETPEREAEPAWEAAAKSTPSRGISSNIKSKRKVPALFKTAQTN